MNQIAKLKCLTDGDSAAGVTRNSVNLTLVQDHAIWFPLQGLHCRDGVIGHWQLTQLLSECKIARFSEPVRARYM